jgi:hypothetical protein
VADGDCPACHTCDASNTCVVVPDSTACGTGGACDDGRCFLADPNCDGIFSPAANSNDVLFCVRPTGTPICSMQACIQTADCPDGQFCATVNCSDGTNHHCAGAYPA